MNIRPENRLFNALGRIAEAQKSRPATFIHWVPLDDWRAMTDEDRANLSSWADRNNHQIGLDCNVSSSAPYHNDNEEYEGEARDRELVGGGFNKDEAS